MAEIIRVFDGNHRRIGEMERVAVHQQGLWHETFHCWFVKGGDEPSIIVQLRSAEKKNYPSMLDITAAGHLESVEEPLDGVREIKEEIGVEVDLDRLLSLGVKHDVQDEASGVRNREFSHVYLYRDDRPLNEYRLQVEEVAALVAVPISAGLDLTFGKLKSVLCSGVRAVEGGTEPFELEVTIEKFIPRVDGYYRKIFALADLWLSGYGYLSI